MENSNDYVKFHYELQIREHHLDTFGHVNNATYLEIFEEALWDLLSFRGFDLKTIHKTGLGPTILECHIKFLKEITLKQHIKIESVTLTYDQKIGTLRQDILNEQNELCCQTTKTFALVDMKARKLILPTPEWLYAVGVTNKLNNV